MIMMVKMIEKLVISSFSLEAVEEDAFAVAAAVVAVVLMMFV